jgi:repressor LexA
VQTAETRDALTKRQQAVLDFITASIDERGYPPTLREIGEHFGIRSTNGVNDHLKALEKKGYLRREDLKSRAMRPVTPISSRAAKGHKKATGKGSQADELADRLAGLNEEFVDVPLIGRVAAGEPLLAVENHEDTVRVDKFFIGTHREVFALRVVGDSMIEDGIHDGDFVFVTKTSQARNGETVVAMIDGEATVKRYHPEGDRIRFQPANSSMQPIYVLRSDFRQVDIVGRVVGVYRKM